MKFNRENKLLIGLCTVGAILIIRLFCIQILDDKYKLDAENNSMVYSTIYPTRGIINDRYGNILVGNKVAYDLLVTPREVKEFDTLTFCNVLDVDIEFVREKMAEYKKNRRRIGYQSVEMIKQLPPEMYVVTDENIVIVTTFGCIELKVMVMVCEKKNRRFVSEEMSFLFS